MQSYIYSKDQIKSLTVVTADTLDVVLDLGFDVSKSLRVKLARIQGPDPNSKGENVRAQAKAAAEYVADKLSSSKEVKLVSYKAGKLGRYLVDVFVDGESLNNLLVQLGHASVFKKTRK